MILVMVVPIPSPGHIKHPPEAMVDVGDLHIFGDHKMKVHNIRGMGLPGLLGISNHNPQ